MSEYPLRVRVVCTGRRRHKRTLLAEGYLHQGLMTWRNSLVEVFAGEVWRGDPGFTGDRYRFPVCARCQRRDITLRGDTFSRSVRALAEATRRDKSVELDLSLLE